MTREFADKLFVNCRVHTQDAEDHVFSQIAIRGKHILGLGDELNALMDQKTEVVDLKGALVFPGFIDAHVHFLWGGESLLTIPGHRASSKREFISLVKNYAGHREPGSWLRGGGWNEHHFTDGSYPHKSWLDEAAPGYPMILHRHDGHSGIASTAALQLAGITRDSQDPEGGVIDKDAQGEPTGILRDAAMALVMEKMPQETEAELVHNLEAAQSYLLDRGVTSVGDMIYDMGHFQFLQKMAKEDKLKVRISAYLPILKWAQIKDLLDAGIFENEWFQFKGLKGFIDGSLGSHTALMLEPYEDTPDSVGIYDTDWADVDTVLSNISESDRLGHQTVVHAIGDRAVREVLDMFESVLLENGPRDRRFRIEHAQHIHPEDQGRFKALDIIPSVQPMHCVDDSIYVEGLLGERSQYAYPFASLVKAGAKLTLGSDWPVSPADPLATIYAAVKRAGWNVQEAMTFKSALETHTRGAAFSCFREHDLGSLKAGHLADLLILDPKVLDIEELSHQPSRLINAVITNGQLARGHYPS